MPLSDPLACLAAFPGTGEAAVVWTLTPVSGPKGDSTELRCQLTHTGTHVGLVTYGGRCPACPRLQVASARVRGSCMSSRGTQALSCL